MYYHDGLTSEQRKKKYPYAILKARAKHSKQRYLADGWVVLTEDMIHTLEVGQEIVCCAYECGCMGQRERVSEIMEHEYDDWHGEEISIFSHSRHEDAFAFYLEDSERGSFELGARGNILINPDRSQLKLQL